MGKSVRDGVNAIANFEDEDEPIAVDPFTDPDEGIPVTIEYKKNAKPKDKYNVTVGTKPKPLSLTDKQLESFDKATPLLEMFRNCYDQDDFDLAVEGLKNFDSDSGIDMWDTDDWTEILEKIAGQYDGSVKPSKKNPKKSDTEDTQVEAYNENGSGDEYDGMDRGELKRLIVREEKLEDVKVFKSDSDDDIRNKIRAVMNVEETEVEEVEEVEEPEEEVKGGDEYDGMDRSELKIHIKTQGFGDDIKVFKSDSDDDIREKIRTHVESAVEVVAGKDMEEEKSAEGDSDSVPSLDDIKKKLGGN